MTNDPTLSVGAFVRLAREHIEGAFNDIWIEGEISNFTRHSSGHCYFTLKDAEAQVRCVMWRNTAARLYFSPTDGMLVRLYGKASVYEKRGDLQLVARALRHAGEGALQQAFEALKNQLSEEGLFDVAYKKMLPAFPQVIGVITSGTGAAVQDILSILARRYPLVEALVCPVQVQGMGAAESISEAIDAFNRWVLEEGRRVDLLIVGRGGGSLEDLWAFNEEVVARSIFASQIPIVSAVGHETDVTISDYVADVRAATPSMAAEIVVPDRLELLAYLRTSTGRATEAMQRRIDQFRAYLDTLTHRHGFRRPMDSLAQHMQRIDELKTRLEQAGGRYLKQRGDAVDQLHRQLNLLDPSRPLKKGYVMVEQDGRLVRSADALRQDIEATLRFHDGKRIVKRAD